MKYKISFKINSNHEISILFRNIARASQSRCVLYVSVIISKVY